MRRRDSIARSVANLTAGEVALSHDAAAPVLSGEGNVPRMEGDMSGDNEYGLRVYESDDADRLAPPLQRALHAEVCRMGALHSDGGYPACARASAVCRRWVSDGAPQ